MKYDDIIKIGTIIAYADDGCIYCVCDLIKKVSEEFPDIDLDILYKGIEKNTEFIYTIDEIKKRLTND